MDGLAARRRLGQRIRDARERLGLSQREFGAALGVAFATVSAWERAQNDIGATDLIRIAEVADLPVSWFFGESVGSRTDLRELVRAQFGEAPEVAMLLQQIDFLVKTRAKRRLNRDSAISPQWSLRELQPA